MLSLSDSKFSFMASVMKLFSKSSKSKDSRDFENSKIFYGVFACLCKDSKSLRIICWKVWKNRPRLNCVKRVPNKPSNVCYRFRFEAFYIKIVYIC